jgi:hypothetical protein
MAHVAFSGHVVGCPRSAINYRERHPTYRDGIDWSVSRFEAHEATRPDLQKVPAIAVADLQLAMTGDSVKLRLDVLRGRVDDVSNSPPSAFRCRITVHILCSLLQGFGGIMISRPSDGLCDADENIDPITQDRRLGISLYSPVCYATRYGRHDDQEGASRGSVLR